MICHLFVLCVAVALAPQALYVPPMSIEASSFQVSFADTSKLYGTILNFVVEWSIVGNRRGSAVVGQMTVPPKITDPVAQVAAELMGLPANTYTVTCSQGVQPATAFVPFSAAAFSRDICE